MRIGQLVIADHPDVEGAIAETGAALRSAAAPKDSVEPLTRLSPDDLTAWDLVVVDLRTAPVSAILDVRAGSPEIPILALVPADAARLALDAVRAGANHYVRARASIPTLRDGIAQAARRARRASVEARPEAPVASPLVGMSPGIATIRAQIRLVASVDAATVLITGESGAGKDVVATEIHAAGRRRDRPFMAIDCASIPDTLLESQLFGHERGAFTDAKQTKKGLFELAHGGTIFLDEIGELPSGTQAKLLRALESRRFRRVGGARDLPLDAAVIAATNRDLVAESQDGRFRADLYYRLNVVRIHVPPLRERPQDIPPLVAHFVERFNRRLGRAFRGADAFAMQVLEEYDWPGNVRELRNVIERAMILNPEERAIRVCDLPPELIEGFESVRDGDAGTAPPPRQTPSGVSVFPADGVDLTSLERELVEAAMRRANGNQTRAAALLGLSRFALKSRLDKYDLAHLAHGRRGRPRRELGRN